MDPGYLSYVCILYSGLLNFDFTYLKLLGLKSVHVSEKLWYPPLKLIHR